MENVHSDAIVKVLKEYQFIIDKKMVESRKFKLGVEFQSIQCLTIISSINLCIPPQL